jgi:hypothetical protein
MREFFLSLKPYQEFFLEDPAHCPFLSSVPLLPTNLPSSHGAQTSHLPPNLTTPLLTTIVSALN